MIAEGWILLERLCNTGATMLPIIDNQLIAEFQFEHADGNVAIIVGV